MLVTLLGDGTQQRFFIHLIENDIQGVEFYNVTIKGGKSFFTYSLPNATLDDAVIFKLKFPNCTIHSFAL